MRQVQAAGAHPAWGSKPFPPNAPALAWRLARSVFYLDSTVRRGRKEMRMNQPLHDPEKPLEPPGPEIPPVPAPGPEIVPPEGPVGPPPEPRPEIQPHTPPPRSTPPLA